MEIIDGIMKIMDIPNKEELKGKLDHSIKLLADKLSEVPGLHDYDSYQVIVSGKGELLGLAINRIIADHGTHLPQKLQDSLRHPMMLGPEFKHIYSGVFGGEVKRYFIEEKIGEENTKRLLDTPNQFILYVDDHVGTGRKATSFFKVLDPLLANGSRAYFASPVLTPGRNATDPRIIIGSQDPTLFEFLQAAAFK